MLGAPLARGVHRILPQPVLYALEIEPLFLRTYAWSGTKSGELSVVN
ncbi:hypothetical protein TRP8649_04376 [Pelagimonas phthalicica]|uniref:Uncharacterized protein n=1 Tax=Pelagimonas phthalicica TaxID=1037362 RepID=A0A238JIM6_9RHOB|nr:hypothetical protein CLV87_4122 [Pelagimonas phthalicica]SMX30233.1 hypothetical protein TRP8649_04376 [Pelagimonas phthalicica]